MVMMDEQRVETEEYAGETMRLERGAPGGMSMRILHSFRYKTLSIHPDRHIDSFVFTPHDAREFAAKLIQFADQYKD